MTNYFYDAAHPLPAPGTDAVLVLTDAGTAFIDLAVTAATGIAVQAAARQRISIGAGGAIHGQGDAIDLGGAGSAVYNEGSIASDTADALHFAGGGTSSVTNSGTIAGAEQHAIAIATTATTDRLDLYDTGTISAAGVAVLGGAGDDRVVNAGILKTTATAAGALALDLGAGNDFYDGTQGHMTGAIALGAGNDTAYGGADDETFIVGSGSNVVNGGGGNDTFVIGPGSNTIDGGEGNDTVDYSFAASAVTVDLRSTMLQVTIPSQTASQLDQIANVENVIGSAHDDALVGSNGNNTLTGGAGNDTLEGGFGSDLLDGGDGIDTVRYSGSFAVKVSLAASGSQDTGIDGSDTLVGIENLEGGSGNDTLTGSGGANTLKGGAGNDTLTGGGGDDLLDGGTGQNTAVFSGPKSAYTITPHADGTFTVMGPDGTDTLKDIRFAQFSDQTTALVNGAPSSIFVAAGSIAENTAPNTTVGTLFGSDPDGDALTWSLVSNAGGLFAVSGTSLVLKGALDYETTRQYTITVKASDPYGKDLVKDVTIAVKNVVETTPLVLKGSAHDDVLAGEAGHDRLSGLRGNDTLWGEAGNDTLVGGPGNDTLVGGTGKDTFWLDTKPNVNTNVDLFYDFAPKDDTIDLSRAAFSKLPRKGVLTKGAFFAGNHVHDADDRILYDKKSGALYYDPDGTGHAAAIEIAVLQKNLKLTYKDFLVI